MIINKLELLPAFGNIYGVSWDGTSTTAWTRTDDAVGFAEPNPYVSGASSYGSPFDTISPWKDMVRVTDAQAGEMVKIPKFWYKITANGNGLKIQIADYNAEGFSVCPTCMDRGDGYGVRDYVLYGRYHCASDYKSKSGGKPLCNIKFITYYNNIVSLGTGITMADFATRFTVMLLYLVEFASWDSQSKIGFGCGDGKGFQNMGYTDTMPYHTGTIKTPRSAYGGEQYRNIEGMWDNCFDLICGCRNQFFGDNGFCITINPNNLSTVDPVLQKSDQFGTWTSGYPKTFRIYNSSKLFPVFLPLSVGGSNTTYTTDYWHYDPAYDYISVGGSYTQNANRGLFYFYGQKDVAASTVGSRLMKLPQ